MHRRQVLFSLVLVVVLALLVSGVASGKAHVPLGNAQVCHNGIGIIVDEDALEDNLDHGDIRLAACDFGNAVGPNQPCAPVDANGDGFADPVNPVNSACGNPNFPACPAGEVDDDDDGDDDDDLEADEIDDICF